MTTTKKTQAIEFIHKIRTMDPKELSALILNEAGEELAQFFLAYSANLIQKDPARVLENSASLMLMGYLICMQEQRNTLNSGTFNNIVGVA